ncbi:myo-inosose-2 dehydratase [Paraburkholderia pallida]|uniref:Myo-inosose-2 dehydratase n=1 Tax=Paraburkholderia pallida TaxID=2547399 RepID=A0A4P7D565_9BURK|nr:myo-inosose-2 dehydratase [Paraburkholderia pallida]QBR01724.1 myo-inosose-2 dehydratase [Paraburkholderia pallida]
MTIAHDIAVHRFDVKIGINPISWFNDDLPTLGGETPLEVALTEGSEIGYQGFELGNKFPREPRVLREVLSRHGLELVSGWYSGRLVERSADEEIAAVVPHLELLAQGGATVMVYGEVSGSIQGDRGAPLYARPRFTSDEQWRAYAKRLDTLARFTLARGVRLAYHHHMGAYVETPDDVDRLMALTSHDVGLLFDSGHAAFGASRSRFDAAAPAALLARHIGRVCHVHCKDVRAEIVETARNRDWSFLDAVINGAFTVPGDGAIDFAPLIEQLRAHGYRGWLVVEAEQDPAVAPSYAFAQAGFRHLQALVEGVQARAEAA